MDKIDMEKMYIEYADPHMIQIFFQETRVYIKNVLGIELSTIEGVGLRKITNDVLRQTSKEGQDKVNGHTIIMPDSEVLYRFISVFYGISYDVAEKIFKNNEETKSWFKMEQKRRHML